MSQGQVKVTIPQIKGYLEEGMTRKQIGEKLSLSMSDVKRLFEHEQLQGLRAKKQPGFLVVDEHDYSDTMGGEHHEDEIYHGDASADVDANEEVVTA